MQRAVRLKKELAMFVSAPPAGISCSPEGDDLGRLTATVAGPQGSPFERGTFTLHVLVPDRYPFEPPQVTFVTPVYHPNVDPSGRICLDALKMPPTGGWRPSLRLATLLISIRLLLAEPNPDDPLMPDVAQEYRFHRARYEEKAAQMTAEHAIPKVVLGSVENRPPRAGAGCSSAAAGDSVSSKRPLNQAGQEQSQTGSLVLVPAGKRPRSDTAPTAGL